MKKNAELLEYRGFLGLDTRADETLVPRPYQIQAKNLILEKGVLKSKPGVELWGTLDEILLPGTRYQQKGFDVGDTEYILMHKGTSLYYGTKNGSWTKIQDLDGADVVVSAAESEMEALGSDVGVTGDLSYKVLFKQQNACKILEFIDSSSSWIGRNPGIDTSNVYFTLNTGIGTFSRAGTYRVRVVARRTVDGVRVNESAPIGTSGAAEDDPPSYQEITLPAGGGTIDVTVWDSSPDSQTTEYGIQITRALDFAGDTEWSKNGDDPTVYYEAHTIDVGDVGINQSIQTDIDTLKVVCPNLIGYKAIPGHLISVVTGNVLFFTGIEGNVNRIYNAGVTGFYYHDELYNPYVFQSGGDDDGQVIKGLAVVQDHLVVGKEAKTGIIPNRDVSAKVVWRDYSLGIDHRNAFQNISEDELIVFNQDKIFRIFNGIRYDRERTISDTIYGFSENIRTKSETIDSSTINFIYQNERVHIIYDNGSEKDALVFHPRDGYGWTYWSDTNISSPFLVSNGSEFIFSYNNRLYKQNADTDDEVTGLQVYWEIQFALMTSQVTKRNMILVKEVAVDGSFVNNIQSMYELDLGRYTGSLRDSVPRVTDGYSTPWFQLPANFQLSAQYLKLTLRGWGEATIRALNWVFIERRTGSPWALSTGSYDPDHFTARGGDIIETGVETYDIHETGTETYDVLEGQ